MDALFDLANYVFAHSIRERELSKAQLAIDRRTFLKKKFNQKSPPMLPPWA